MKNSKQLVSLLFCALIAVPPPTLAEAVHSFSSDADYVVVPGKSCGKVALGMSKPEVLKLLRAPKEKQPPEKKDEPEIWVYKAKQNWVHIFFANDKVVQIDFTSPAFKTEEGFSTDLKKVDEDKNAFNNAEIPWRFRHLRYQFKKGGLSYYVINSDSANPEYVVSKVGSVYKGSRPIVEAFGLTQEPNNGWRPTREAPSAPLEMHQFLPKISMDRDLGNGYTYRQHTNERGIVTSAEVLHGKKVIDSYEPPDASIVPVIADSQGQPVCKDLDADGVPELALLLAEDTNPPSFLLRVSPLKGDKLENKYYEKFYGKKPAALPADKPGQLGMQVTDCSYVYSFGDPALSPIPLMNLRWVNKYPFKISIDEMKKPPLSPSELKTAVKKLAKPEDDKESIKEAFAAEKSNEKKSDKPEVFDISQALLQSVFGLIYTGRGEDAKKVIAELWPEKQMGQWKDGPLIDRDQFWLEVTERLPDSPYYDDLVKMNGDSIRWQNAVK